MKAVTPLSNPREFALYVQGRDLREKVLAIVQSVYGAEEFDDPHWPEKATAAIFALPEIAGAGWRPIETAPKSEMAILYYPEWRGDGPLMAINYIPWGHERMPTHWMPLPAAPLQNADEAQTPTTKTDRAA